MDINNIKISPVFESIFDIDNAVYVRVLESMRESGFDPAHPVTLWGETGILIDGHTRIRAAREAGISVIYYCPKYFDNEAEALLYARNCQLNRRNLTPDQRALLLHEINEQMKKKQGAPEGNNNAGKQRAQNEPIESKRTVEVIAEQQGLSPATVKRAIARGKEIASSPEKLAEVKAGKLEPKKRKSEPNRTIECKPAKAKSLSDKFNEHLENVSQSIHRLSACEINQEFAFQAITETRGLIQQLHSIINTLVAYTESSSGAAIMLGMTESEFLKYAFKNGPRYEMHEKKYYFATSDIEKLRDSRK